MAPALSTDSTAFAPNTTLPSASAAEVPSAPAHAPPVAALVIATLLVVAVSIGCAIALFRLVQDCLALRAHRAKKKQTIRPLVLRSGSSKVASAAGPQGPKPLLLPAMSTVRSSRAKASLASKFLGTWGATHIQQIEKDNVECAPSPTLVGSDADDKPKERLGPEWTPRQLYALPVSKAVRAPSVLIPIALLESKPLALAIAEDLAVPKPAHIPEDELSVDVVEVSPSVSGSALVSLLAADVDLVAVPTIVVHNCSRPSSAALDLADAEDRLRVPSASWYACLDDDELEEPASAHEGF